MNPRDSVHLPHGSIVTALWVLVCALPLFTVVPPLGQAADEAAAEPFLDAYWRTPIPLQGAPPADFAAPTRSLDPAQCGLCHYRQFQDWRTSWHANAMGPGVVGQFPGFGAGGQASCRACHAPLSEQWPALPAENGRWNANDRYDAALDRQGVTCAACHLRGHQRHGPPFDPARVAAGTDGASALLHGPPLRTPHFRASAFCKGCHQHGAEALRVNGKAVQNTYTEWQASPAAAEGKTCQSCHMPEGRHLWRGIHDPEFTRSGVRFDLRVEPTRPVADAPLTATLTLTNTGTGHAFPTYTTPAVYLRAALLDAQGQVLDGDYFAERLLQRRLNMGTSPWSEAFDTRLQPGASATLTFARRVPPAAATLYVWVWVEPDHFYAGFYRSYLRNGADFPGGAQLRTALQNAEASPYALFSQRISVRPAR